MSGTKRAPEDLLPAHGDLGHDAKKVKLMSSEQGELTPSRVLHVRHLPPNATEVEVAALGAPFGRVINIMILRTRNQALMEMADEASATALVNFYNYVSANIRGLPVYIQYSNHTELKTTQASGINSSAALTSHPMMTTQMQSSLASTLGLPAGAGAAAMAALVPSMQAGGLEGMVDPEGPTILHIMIDNMIYPVTLEVLHTIFSKFGTVLRIVTFNKNGQFQALIEYPDGASGSAAKFNLDGQNIYDRCCTMRVEASKLKTLTVKSNNERQRDYTRPDTGEVQHGAFAAQFPGAGPAAAMMMAGAGSSGASPVILVSNLNQEAVTPHEIFILFGVYGDVQRVKILFNKKDAALIQMATPQQAQTAQNYLNKVTFFGKEMHITLSRHSQVSLPRDGQEDAGLTKDFSQSPLHRFKNPGSHNYQNIYAPSPCLHMSNIPESITEEFLRDAFERVGGTIVGFRWIPLKGDEAETKKDRRMALMQLGSTEHAVQSLVAMHNFQLAEKRYLKVSFAKSQSL